MGRFRQFVAADIPFARDDAHRLLPAMIACLIGFAALLFSVALSINHAVSRQSQSVIGVVQVEVPRARAEDKTAMASILSVLSATQGVEQVEVLGKAQMETLLKPWLGTDFALGELPLPVILDVKTTVSGGKSQLDTESLKRGLARIDGTIRVEETGPWVAQVAHATGLLQLVVIVMALLLLGCVVGMIVLVAKTNLRLHFKTVNLLHLFGATDDYILRQFQFNSAWLALRGAFAGVLLAWLVFSLAVILSARWESPVFPAIGFSVMHVLLFVALPLVTAAIALAATRASVRVMLRHMH